jgi:hypothetical protein
VFEFENGGSVRGDVRERLFEREAVFEYAGANLREERAGAVD